MHATRKFRRMVWKLPLTEQDATDLRDINHRLERLRAITRHYERLRHSILQRARLAWKLQNGWAPIPGATRLSPPKRTPHKPMQQGD